MQVGDNDSGPRFSNVISLVVNLKRPVSLFGIRIFGNECEALSGMKSLFDDDDVVHDDDDSDGGGDDAVDPVLEELEG